MATLQNIRNRGVLIAAIIGFALLAFIIGDFLNSGSSLFHQSKEIVAEIAGDKIKIAEFQNDIEKEKNFYSIDRNIREFNEEMTTQIQQSAWNNLVNEKILNAEAKKIGLSVSKEELTDRLIGKNIHPIILQRPIFMDERGQFSHVALMNFYNGVFNENNTQQSEESKEQLQKAKDYWLFVERAVKNAILQEKYVALFTKTIGSNTIEAKYNFDARKFTGDVNYIVQPYFSISDSAVTVSKDELKARYEKEKELFKQNASRSIDFVSFEVLPLADDFKKAEEWNKKVSEEFKTTTDVEGLVNSESDISYDGRNYSAQTVPANLKDFAFNSPAGAIFGPVFQNNTYTMAKVMQAGIMESDSLKLAHIAVADEKTADSIMTSLKGGANFAELARKHSLAQQTAANGGEIGWLPAKAAGAEIEKEAETKGVGELFKIASPQGVQIFKIEEKSPARRKVKLAILERKIIASPQSQAKIFNDAKQFAATAADDDFQKTAAAKKYVVHPAANLDENATSISMIPQSRQVVRWAFKNGKGKVSDVIECGNSFFVVARVSEINAKGYQSLEKATPQLKAEIIKDKKAEMISKNLSALISKNGTIEGLAAATGSAVKLAAAINFNSFQFGDAGFEPYVIGKSSVLPAGKISTPLKGNAGVFVIFPLTKQPETAPFNAKLEIAQMDARVSYSLPYTIIEKLRDKYEIKDNRSNFY